MKWLRKILGTTRDGSHEAPIRSLQEKFRFFVDILGNNNQVLEIMSDMEEKSRGESLFDVNYIHSSLTRIRTGVSAMIERMISLGGQERYGVLRRVYAGIDQEIESILPGGRLLEKDAFTLPLEKLGRHLASSVGSKNANLGEMKSLGLPVPEGFAITAWAYQYFVDAGQLRERISDLVHTVDFTRFEDLARASSEIQALVRASPVPDDLAEAIRKSYEELAARSGSPRAALRSSAIGEDTLFSFAGQYASFLNLSGEDVVRQYREVLASKFTPQAIYYLLSHDLPESGQAMSVSCVSMVDAASSGVVYSRDPVRPEEACVLVHSVFGLGSYVVDGSLTPDAFRISREDGRVLDRQLAIKPVRLAARQEGGTEEEPVPEAEQGAASTGEVHLKRLAEIAVKLEDHFGNPQDIEYAIDSRGKLFLLQTRPLRVMRTASRHHDPERPDVLASGGTTVSPGADSGPVVQVSSARDLPGVQKGAVVVAPRPFPGLITVMSKVSAIVTEVGSKASHMATLAREYRIPTLVGLKGATSLPQGEVVTVDATAGAVYRGSHPELVEACRPDREPFGDSPVFKLLERILSRVSPLNLLNPSALDFTPDRCRTVHDVTRFCHQKSMEEMFSGAISIKVKDQVGLLLKSEIPLEVKVIYIDRNLSEYRNRRFIQESDIASIPMEALWRGIREEGWPTRLPPAERKGLLAVMARTMPQEDQPEYSEKSFAVLGRQYMILSLRMGYHFTTVEAMCAPETNKNFIRMQYKGGGSSSDRRVRRVFLLTEILSRLGFENIEKGDFLRATVAYDSAEAIQSKLQILGRLIMMTKQLDMALSSDAITRWYAEDFMKKLRLGNCPDRHA